MLRPVLVLLAACNKEPAEDAPPPDEATPWSCPTTPGSGFNEVIGWIEDDLALTGAPGRAFAVVADGRIVGCAGLGTKVPGRSDPVGPHTLFRIGSQTKSLTALTVLHAVEHDLLTLDTTLADIDPTWDLASSPGWAAEVDLRRLLSHQHGLYDWLLIDDDQTLDRWVTDFAASQLWSMAPPGTFWNYSNPGYYLAAWALERVTGQPYEELLKEQVLDPLGMTRTVFDARDVRDDGDFALGMGDDGTVYGPSDYDNPWARPAGYLWSSVEDLARETRVLMEGHTTIVDDALLAEWTRPQVETGQAPGLESYALGWFIQEGVFTPDFVPQRLVLHGGDISGFAADVITAPEQGFAVIVLTSGDGAHLGGEALVRLLERYAPVNPDPMAAPDWTWTADDLTWAAGDYDDPYNVGPLHFAVNGEALRVEAPLLDDLDIPYEPEVEPFLRDNYIFEVQAYPLLLTFLGEEPAGATWARTRAFVGERDEGGVISARSAPASDALRLSAPSLRPRASTRSPAP